MRMRFALCLSVSLAAFAADQNADLFESKIRPVLASQCYPCHTGKSAAAGLHLDSAEATHGVVESGKLLHAIHRDGDLKMPPSGALTEDQIADFEAWIKAGAPDPRTEKPSPPYDFDQARKFWSFQPVKDPDPPQVAGRAWNKTPIDRFIKAKLDEKKLVPLGRASKHDLIRRATFDLTGLPPTPEEVAAFLADNSPNAFDKVIDRLLASPQYGERWGRHWLDLVRYADTSGCNADFPVPDAYRYRNWVINALNQDMPYDEFLREQLAGDLLPSKNDEDYNAKHIATGYIAISRRFSSAANEFFLTIDDTIDNVGKSMLGLSVSCARCHDHKFDPVPQRDYYALYGIFQSTTYAFPGTELYPHAHDFVPLRAPGASTRLVSWENDISDLEHRVQAFVDMKEGKDLSKEDREKEIKKLKDRIVLLEHDAPGFAPKTYAAGEGAPVSAKIQIHGDPYHLGEEVPRGFLTVLGGQTLPPEEKGSGRRELAQWITDPTNPLTARVLVNRVWQHHFGKGIVGSPNDFGTRGDRPVNPELLDWLATRFRESGYSIKAMHRLIMRTSAYQMASGSNESDAHIDPKNDFLWRFDRRRLDAEEIRDAMLDIAGDLDKSMGGPHPFPPELTFRYTQHTQFFAVYPTTRRSVYLMQQRLKRHPFLDTFDGADPNASTPARSAEETSLQALAMLN
ncbi:MAG TPA: PSD1 and planctomycete cytochrome C domain-containing protein, partial [Bryobacteraceae bacterium]|nr:PSD1 and planctomycete cytochrome C domain-containing protein [Bryobacteraceae bacterium]